MDYIPDAKLLSVLIIIPTVILYAKLVDWLPRHRVFYVLTGFYGITGLILAALLQHPTIGLANQIPDATRLIGWVWYVYVESFGSLLPALFWAFAADISTEESAKRGFPLVYIFAQFGNIFGPLFLNARRLGFATSAPIVGIIGILILCISLLVWLFMRSIPPSQMIGYEEKIHIHEEKKTGFLEGLRLLMTQNYLLGIFLIISIYQVIMTIIDYQLQTMAKAAYPLECDNAAFLTNIAVATGIVAFLAVFLGINTIQRRFGMTPSLITMPVLVAGTVALLWYSPTLGMVSVLFVLGRGINYALNQPTIKQLYVPTTKDAHYKAQAWIEMFGSRGSKGTGSFINKMRRPLIKAFGADLGIAQFIMYSSLISFGLIGAWLFIAVFVAKQYNSAIKEKKVVC